MSGTCSTHGVRNLHTVLVERFRGKRPLARPRNRREDNIEVDNRYMTLWTVFNRLRIRSIEERM
jgi:hypothetical protein